MPFHVKPFTDLLCEVVLPKCGWGVKKIRHAKTGAIMTQGGFDASPNVDRTKEKPPLHEEWRLRRGVLAVNV
jgi:hypothetical protein